MLLFSFLAIMFWIVIAVLSHIVATLVVYVLSGAILFTPYELWRYTDFGIFSTIVLYTLYTIFAPVFGIIGLVVWLINKEY